MARAVEPYTVFLTHAIDPSTVLGTVILTYSIESSTILYLTLLITALGDNYNMERYS